jgi:hypothetical protein
LAGVNREDDRVDERAKRTNRDWSLNVVGLDVEWRWMSRGDGCREVMDVERRGWGIEEDFI